MSKVRECVFQALADIPDIIARAEVYIEIYKVHPARRLNQTTVALFKAILISLRLILEFFGTSSVGKHPKITILTSADILWIVKTMKMLALGSAHEKPLVESIQNIRTLAKRIKEEASQCMQERLCGVDQTVVGVHSNVIRVDANVLSLLQRMEDLPQALYRLFQSNPLVDRRTGQGRVAQGSK